MRFRTDERERRARPGARLGRAAVILASVIALAVTGGATASAATAATHTASFRHACATPDRARVMQCMTLIDTAVAQTPAATMATRHHAAPSGYGPSQLQSAYNLASAAASNGSGETVYIVDSYDYPTAQADLNAYRSQYGLPACGSGCFTKVSQTGSTTSLPTAAGSTGWDVEEALDIDMVSAICPNCHITLVEANSAGGNDLYVAENEAVTLGGKFISNSWGGSEYSGETSDANTYFNHPGVAITVSAGDSPGPEFPAEAPGVTSVGGTTLSTSSNSRGWTESPWSDSGGGCSTQEAAPSCRPAP